MQLKDAQTEEERVGIEDKKTKHLKEASLRYELKQMDKEISKKDKNSKVIMVDLQKCLPMPYLSNSQSFI